MSEQESKGLAQQLLDTEEKTIALMNATTDPEKRRQLSALRKKISAEAGRLIDKELDAATAEYRAAADGVQKACNMADEGIQDVNFVQAAIDMLGKAMDLVSKIAV